MHFCSEAARKKHNVPSASVTIYFLLMLQCYRYFILFNSSNHNTECKLLSMNLSLLVKVKYMTINLLVLVKLM